MKKPVGIISKILLSIATIPLWFVKMFASVGHLPNQNGEIVEVVFRHSMFENIGDIGGSIFVYIAIISALLSVVINTFGFLFPKNKTVRVGANIAFVFAIGLFLMLLLVASSVARGY